MGAGPNRLRPKRKRKTPGIDDLSSHLLVERIGICGEESMFVKRQDIAAHAPSFAPHRP